MLATLSTFLRRLFAPAAQRELLAIGSLAPEFEARDQDGRLVRSRDLAGGRFLLWFFPRAGTPECTRQGCAYRDRIREYEARGVRVLGVSFDPPEANQRFAAEHAFPFALLSDPDRRIALRFRAASRPSDAYARRVTYVIGPEGHVEQALETKNPGAQAGALLETISG